MLRLSSWPLSSFLVLSLIVTHSSAFTTFERQSIDRFGPSNKSDGYCTAASVQHATSRSWAKPPPTSQFDLEAIEEFERELTARPVAEEDDDDLEDLEVGDADQETLMLTVTDQDYNKRIDTVIASALPKLSRSQCASLITDGHVRLINREGKFLQILNRKAFKVEQGMMLHVTVPMEEAPTEIVAQKLPLSILYEDEHMIVINKAADTVVHPAAGNWDGTVVNALAHYLAHESPYGRGDFVGSAAIDEAEADVAIDGTDGETVTFRPGIVHRLDKGTTGVLVVAKTRTSLAALSEAFKSRQVKKTYLTVTVGNPGKQVVIDKPIGRHPVHRQRMRVVPDPHRRNSGGFAPKDRMTMQTTAQAGRRALSYVDTLCFDGKLSLAQVRIETGRTHQIRVHLQDRRTPVYGDDIYGLSDWNSRLSKVHQISRPLLHAYTLELQHPVTGESLHFRAPMAEDMERIVRTIWPQGLNERPDLFEA